MSARRGGRPSTYEQRREALARLFYQMTDDEMNLRRPGTSDLAARAVMTDALEERGMGQLARELRRWPRDRKLGGTLFYQKLRRAIMGPEKRPTYAPYKPRKSIPLAFVGSGWLEIDFWLVDDPDGLDWLFEIPMGYNATTVLVRAGSYEAAIGAAEERWPHLFFDEVDPDDPDLEGDAEPHPTKRGIWVVPTEGIRVRRPSRVANARLVDKDRDQAFIEGVGLVTYLR